MKEKEEMILKEIIEYFKNNKRMPTMRYLQTKMNYKSINSITWYLNSLEKQGYLERNKENKLILNNSSENYNTGLKRIKIINMYNKYINLVMNKNKKYFAYKINNDYFNELGIIKKDILIIENNKKLYNGDLGLFIVDNKYRIMIYQYKDGFYLLKDKEELLLYKVNILGKVIAIERKL